MLLASRTFRYHAACSPGALSGSGAGSSVTEIAESWVVITGGSMTAGSSGAATGSGSAVTSSGSGAASEMSTAAAGAAMMLERGEGCLEAAP